MSSGLGELMQKLREIAKAKEASRRQQPEGWMWQESPQRWEAMLLVVADFLMRAEPGSRYVRPDGSELHDAVLGVGAGHDSVIAALKELGALLRRVVAGEEDARRVFLHDKRTKPGRWSEHRQIAIAYWTARASDPTVATRAAIEAARRVPVIRRSRPLTVATIRRITRNYRSDALEHLVRFAGQDGRPSVEQVTQLMEYLQGKSKQGKWDEPLESVLPELPPPISSPIQQQGASISPRPLPRKSGRQSSVPRATRSRSPRPVLSETRAKSET
jgi:hypothetical protein